MVAKAAIIRVLGQVLQSEIATVSSDDFDSITRKKFKNYLLNFEGIVHDIMDEMKDKGYFKGMFKNKEDEK